MLIFDKVDTYVGGGKDLDFLGYVPVLDPTYNGCAYYSCENVHPEREYERVVPCYHLNVENEWINPTEQWCMQPSLPRGVHHDLVLQHQVLKDDYIERFNTMKYIVMFIGCDDGDKIMRFLNKEHALEYLNSVSSFEEIYDNDFIMEYM